MMTTTESRTDAATPSFFDCFKLLAKHWHGLGVAMNTMDCRIDDARDALALLPLANMQDAGAVAKAETLGASINSMQATITDHIAAYMDHPIEGLFVELESNTDIDRERWRECAERLGSGRTLRKMTFRTRPSLCGLLPLRRAMQRLDRGGFTAQWLRQFCKDHSDVAAAAGIVGMRKASRKMQTAHRLAAASLKWVESERPDLTTRREQWEYLHENGCPCYEEAGRDIPTSWRCWARQVRAGSQNGNNSPRAGREHGSSVVESVII